MLLWNKPATLYFLFLKNLRLSKSQMYWKSFSITS
jgi:hypothetical protein